MGKGHKRLSHQAAAATSDAHFAFDFQQSMPVAPDYDAYVAQDSEELPDSVFNYPVEFGRTYHAYKAGSYLYPNDQREQDRETRQYNIVHTCMNGHLFHAPLSRRHPPRRILDVATGVGNWAIAMGDAFPASQIHGIDLSPTQPDLVPPNCHFFIQDASQPWSFPEPFDFIHTRLTLGCWSDFKTEIAQQAFNNLAPGGWFESQELLPSFISDDGSLPADSALVQWVSRLWEASSSLSRSLFFAHELKRHFEEVGFVDVHEKVYKVPVNPWPKDPMLKELGRAWEANILEGLSGFSVNLFNKAYGMSQAQTEVGLVPVREDISNARIHTYTPVYVVWGRKPGEPKGKTKSARP